MPGMDGVRANVGPGIRIGACRVSTTQHQYGYDTDMVLETRVVWKKTHKCCTIPVPKMMGKNHYNRHLDVVNKQTKQNDIKPTLP